MASQGVGMQLSAPADVVLMVDADAGLVLNSLSRKLDDAQIRHPCTIFKVRDKIRSEDPGSYTPQIISIGPYHHGNKLLLPMERIKWQFLQSLIGRHHFNSLPIYIMALNSASSVAKASKYYSEYVLASDGINTFVEMMVLDGCFIIEFLVRLFLGENMGELDFVNWNRSLVENDLRLLENQVPFFVLESLFGSSFIPGITNVYPPITLEELASSCVSWDRKNNVQPIPTVVYHLLHLRHSSLASHTQSIPYHQKKNTQSIKTKWFSCISVRGTCKATENIKECFFFLVSLLLSCCRRPPEEMGQAAPWSLPSATELKKSGIKFRLKIK